jgi:cell division inhibitor SepF
MAGALRKTMVYLGLAEDEGRYYDEAYDEYDHEAAAYEPEETPETRERSAEVTPLPNRRSVAQVVRSPEASGISRITTIHPRTYNEAKQIGESFRESTPVIMNLSDMDDSDAKRLVDFAAGLVFGLRGTIERVTNKVFLLSPADVTVTAEDKARMAESGFFNQS